MRLFHRMMRSGILAGLLLLSPIAALCAAAPTSTPQIVQADICVYGGTAGGVAAAVQAARLGKRVVLAEPGGHLGGMTAGGLSAVDIGDPRSIGGIAREYFTALAGGYGKTLAWDEPFKSTGGPATGGAFAIEPHRAEALFNEMIKNARVPVHFQARLAAVRKDGARIREIVMEDGAIFRAKMFIDATYEGDLMARAGVGCTLTREGNAKYGERYNGIIYSPRFAPRWDHVTPGPNGRAPSGLGVWDRDLPLDPYVVPGDPKSGLLPFVQAGDPGREGDPAPGVQAYCFRLCLTTAADRIPIAPPPDYDAQRYEIVARFIAGCLKIGDDMDLRWFSKYDPLPNDKYDFNTATFGSNLPGASWEWPAASYARREQIAKEHENYHRGLFHFLATDPRVPAKVRAEVRRFGLPRDEFKDNGGWPHQIYIREARRMVSDLVMTEHHTYGREVAPQSIALGSYGTDTHEIRRIARDGVVIREGKTAGGRDDAGPYPIGYGAIVPKAKECENLLVTFALSASHTAFSSIRMEPVFMVSSQSAATAASLAIDDGVPVQRVDYAKLRARLLADKQVLEWTAAAPEKTERPRLSRADLARLKKLDRAGTFAALGSFDDRGLAEDAFVLQAAQLLDPSRVPGLARAAGDAAQTLDAVDRACRKTQAPAGRSTVSPAQRALADGVLAHRFSFYNETYPLPPEIDWEHNPGTAHWGHDLNRFSYLDPLARTYLATDDARYSREAVALMLAWIAQSDFAKCFTGTPYVFGSYLNNAIQCTAWSECLGTLLPRGQVRPIELLRILKSLHDHLAYLEIVTNAHAGNWPTIGCRGMLECVAAFPMLRDTNRFADSAARTLTAQIMDQVKPDGVQDELTPHYHRVVVGNLLGVVRPLRALGRRLDPATLAALRKMVRYVQQTTMPDGSKMAAFNDSDPGSPGDIAEQLAEVGLSDLLAPPASLGPECFPYAGVALLRQRQDRGDLYLAFDAGPYGRGHQHEDKLGFWLFAYGRSFLVDPGRHLYDHSARSYYDYLKSTAAHSTIRIDGEGQHSAGRRATWIPQKPLDLGWRVAEGEVRARGAYDLGYGPKNTIATVHRREIVFVKDRFWIVFDALEGAGEHLVESRFQFAPGELIVDGATARTSFPEANLLLRCAATVPFTGIHVERGRENPRGGWYSDGYGKIEPAPALSLAVRTRLPLRAATLLFPYRGAKPPEASLALDGTSAVIRTAETGELRVESSL